MTCHWNEAAVSDQSLKLVENSFKHLWWCFRHSPLLSLKSLMYDHCNHCWIVYNGIIWFSLAVLVIGLVINYSFCDSLY